jgi:8-oxo-dGTP diphosphatase
MLEKKNLFPLVTVDIALFTIDGGALKVLLAKRTNAPYAGQWALPGGALDPDVDSDLSAAANRVITSKLGLTLAHIEEVGSFSGAARDPRGWSIAVLFLALLPMDQVPAIAGKRVDAVEWVKVSDLPELLAFDHPLLVNRAVEHLKNKVARNVLPVHMLPEKFTLTQLQKTMEAVLGIAIEKSAFRRRLKERHFDDLEEVVGEFERGVQRPAQLWRARAGFRFY